MHYIYWVKLGAFFIIGSVLALSSVVPSHAHTNGAAKVHEVAQEVAPKAVLEIEKDPTGGFNVHLETSNFLWSPEMASKKHIEGHGHAHVYLDGRKIMRIYSEWFHLNPYQFATKPGEQLLTIEFVGNDHAPYTIKGLPAGAEQIVDVPSDEIAPSPSDKNPIPTGTIILSAFVLAGVFFITRRVKVFYTHP